MTNNTAEEIRNVINQNSNFYLAGHVSPDGDSIGSCFGLGMALEKLGKKVQVLMEPFHSKYDIIPGRHLLGSAKLENPVLICLDCADEGRLTGYSKELMGTLQDTVCIDHHYTNTYFAKFNYVDEKASSTCEVVYRLLDSFVEFDIDIASALYAGILSDTGGFRYNATSQNTLSVAGALTAMGIPFTDIYTELFSLRTYAEVKLLARVLENCQRAANARVVHVCVPREMMTNLEDTTDAEPKHLEGVVESLLNIRRAEVSILIYDRCKNDELKISLRSRKLNIGDIAQKYGGGGHQLAAGATVKGDIYEIRDKVLGCVLEALEEQQRTK